MKCVCGYEQEGNFPVVTYDEPVQWDKRGKVTAVKIQQIPGLHSCPKCGTVKIKVNGETVKGGLTDA